MAFALREEAEEKDRQRKQVQVNMQQNELSRKNQIEQKRRETDYKVAMTFEEKRKSQMLKKGMEDTIREDR